MAYLDAEARKGYQESEELKDRTATQGREDQEATKVNEGHKDDQDETAKTAKTGRAQGRPQGRAPHQE